MTAKTKKNHNREETSIQNLTNAQRQELSEKIKRMALAEVCRRSYYQFLKTLWHTVVTDEYIDGWHIEYLCERLQEIIERIARGEKREKHLIINMPPRASKTTICSIFLNAWAWTKYPHLKFITVGYSDALVQKSSIRTKLCMESELYQSLFGDIWQFSQKKNTNAEFWNSAGGFRFATSVGGTITGEGADVIILDDLLSAYDSYSPAMRANTYRFFTDSVRNRLDMPEIGHFVMMGQRVHEEDPTGLEIKNSPHLWERIILPAIDMPAPITILPAHLKSFYTDGLLEPVRLSRNALDALSKSESYVTQYLQCPELQVTKGMLYARGFNSTTHTNSFSNLAVNNDAIYLAMDANTRPYSYCLVMKAEVTAYWETSYGIWRKGDIKSITVYAIDEIAQYDNIHDTANEFVRRLAVEKRPNYARYIDDARVLYGGDASLNTAGAGKRSWESNFATLRSILGTYADRNVAISAITGKQIVPTVAGRGDFLNAILSGLMETRTGINVSLSIDAVKCPELLKDINTSRVSDDGGIVVERIKDKDGVSYEANGHALSALTCFLVQRFIRAYDIAMGK